VFTGIAVKHGATTTQRDQLKRFLRGTIEGNYLAFTDETRAKEVLAKELHVTDPKLVVASYKDYRLQTPLNGEPVGAENTLALFPGASSKVEDYVKYRPGYPRAVIALLTAKCALSRDSVVADVGSGTGILSELLLRHGNTVYGIEPNKEMRAAAERLLEAMVAGNLILAHDNEFNRETCDGCAHFFGSAEDLSDLMRRAEAEPRQHEEDDALEGGHGGAT